ncbi:NAD(P)-binding domain-containing protein, partial [Bifidobacterium longum]|uniref:NAD(P)-binding domain-containing protein n=1 Tax=Bifidobacterium longum TaxID=216816 RepID=UPI00019CBA83
MGLPMANSLARSGFDVTTWSRRPLAAGALAPTVRWRSSLQQAVEEADVVILMLTDSRAVEAVLFEGGAASACKPGA